MRKKFIIAMLIVCVVTGSIYNKPMQVKAAASSAAVTSYVAEKVFLALLALAGVVVKSSDIEFIWDEGGLNVDALINNMMAYSRDLGMSMRECLSLGAAGATTLMLQRNIWNIFKAWARDKYGTDTTVTHTLSNKNVDIKPLKAGDLFHVTYINNNQVGYYNIFFPIDVIIFRTESYTSGSINPWIYSYFVVPVERYTDLNSVYRAVQITGSGNTQYRGGGIGTLNSTLGQYMDFSFGMSNANYFSAFEENIRVYDFGTSYNELLADLISLVTEFRTNGSLTQAEDITASVTEGVDNQAATSVGQDVVSYDNTAAQEGQDVILEGPLAVALPDAATLEVLLKQLADEDITYEDYVRALGLAAVKTTDTTAEAVQQKEQAITVNPVVGNYTVSLDSLFPFCIPFDLYDILAAFNAEPSAPQVTISIPTGYDGDTFTWHEYTISLSDFDTVAQVVRIFEYIIFCIGLMLMTRKLIEG